MTYSVYGCAGARGAARRGSQTGRASTRWKVAAVGSGRVVSDVAACWLPVFCCGACARWPRRPTPRARRAPTTSCPPATNTPSSSRERVSGRPHHTRIDLSSDHIRTRSLMKFGMYICN